MSLVGLCWAGLGAICFGFTDGLGYAVLDRIMIDWVEICWVMVGWV